MTLTFDIFLKLVLSMVIGGIIGAEREYQNKSAGFRTMMLISLGATLFTLISIYIAGTDTPDRIASNIVTGIGFVGAGVIFKGDSGVNGITTAATIWVTAALGMAIGAGYEWIAITGCLLLLPILFAFTKIESWFDRLNKSYTYKIVCAYDPHVPERYENLFREYRLHFKNILFQKDKNIVTVSWNVHGREINHHKLIDRIRKDPVIEKFEY